jgi:hypothetical protein
MQCAVSNDKYKIGLRKTRIFDGANGNIINKNPTEFEFFLIAESDVGC